MEKVLGLKPEPYFEQGEVIVKKRPCINFGKSQKSKLGYPFITESFNDKDDNWGSLAQQRVYASDQFEKTSSKLIIDSINKPKLTYDGLLKAKEMLKSCYPSKPTHLILGDKAWSAMNLEANLFSSLPKTTWDDCFSNPNRPTIHIKCL